MTTIPLTRTEASFLHAAAKAEGRLQFAPTMKPASRERLVGRFLRDALIAPADASNGQHRLTLAGYEAIGLTPPAAPVTPPRANKKAQVLALLTREEGATLAELMAATGWLAHTTRAALSRIRSAGQPLAKAARADATTVYRILPPPPATRSRPRRSSKTPGGEASTGAPAQAAA